MGEKEIKCPACHGEGCFIEQHGESHRCSYCNGKGYATQKKRMEYVRRYKEIDEDLRRMICEANSID